MPRPPRLLLWISLALVLALGTWLRFDGFSELEFSHWDEGAFAASSTGNTAYGNAPIAILYGPPLFPWMLRVAFALLGTSAAAAIAVSALAGCLSLAVFFMLARHFASFGQAIIATLLLSVSEFHLIYSRMALSDVTFLLAFMTTLLLGVAALKRRSRALFVIAGLAAAMTTWIKYHGLLALVVAALIFLFAPPALDHLGTHEPLRSRLARLRRSIGWTVLGYLPLILALVIFIDTTAGLRAFFEHRQRWVAPLNLTALASGFTFTARCLLAWVSPPLLVAAGWGIVLAVRRNRACRAYLVWLLVYATMLPFYTNFPRLLLPLIPPLLLLAATGLEDLGATLARLFKVRRATVFGSMALALLAASTSLVGAWDSLTFRSNGYAVAARRINELCTPQTRCLLLTQPCILFYLADTPGKFLTYTHNDRNGCLYSLRTGDYDLLVIDQRILYNPPFDTYLSQNLDQLQLVELIPNQVRDSTLVNAFSFERVARARESKDSPEAMACSAIRIFRKPRS